MVPTRIKATGAVILSDEVRAYAEEKVGKLEKYVDTSDTTNLFELELEALPLRTGNAYRAELNFSSRGRVMRTEGRGESLHAAIDELVEEASRRMRKHKNKHIDLVRKGGAEVKKFFRRLGGGI